MTFRNGFNYGLLLDQEMPFLVAKVHGTVFRLRGLFFEKR